MTNEIWLSIEDACSLSNEKIETARRKCKSGIYTSKFEKEGKFKKYSILLASLPESVQKKYIENNVSKDESVNVIQENCDSYANAPEWARKQADKYLEIFNLTEGLNFKETKAFFLRSGRIFPPNLSLRKSRNTQSIPEFPHLNLGVNLSPRSSKSSFF